MKSKIVSILFALLSISYTSFSADFGVTITSTAGNPTNVSPIPITITFVVSVADFTAGDITVGNGTVTAASFSGSGTTYTATITPSGEGIVTIDINAGVATNGADSNTAAAQLSRTYDSQAPTATISYSPAAGPYKSGTSLTITATFNESMLDSPVPQISLGGGPTVLALTDMAKTSATVYTYTYTIPAGNGTQTVTLGTGTDLAGNIVIFTPTSGDAYTVDNTSPTAAITYSPAIGPYKSGTSLTITATFSESMLDSPIPQISLSGGPTVLALTDMAKTSATVYTYTYTIPAGNGIQTVTLGTGTDHAGNIVTSIPTSGDTYTVDNTPPTAAISYNPSSGTYNTGTSLTITATFSEPMADSPKPQISLSGSPTTLALTDMTKVSSTVYTYTYTIPSGSGTQTVSLGTGTDIAGNVVTSIPTSGLTFQVDNAAPTADITYSPSSGYYKNGTSLTITATFNKPMADSPKPQISLSGPNALALTDMIKTSSTEYTYTYTVSSGNGVQTVSLGTGKDLAGNIITSTPTSGANYNIDNTVPTAVVTYSPSTGYYKSGTSLTITATFSEPMLDSPVPQISLSGVPTVLALTNMAKTSSTVYTYTYTIPAGNGTQTVALGTGTDRAGNLITATPTSGATYVVDNTAPSFNATILPATSVYTVTQNIDFIVNYNENVIVDTLPGVKPYLTIDIGSRSNVTVPFFSGSGTSALTFRYTVIVGDYDDNGINMDNNINLPVGAAIKDNAGNNALLNLSGGGNISGVKVDARRPAIISIVAPTSSWYKKNEYLIFTVNYDKQVKIDFPGSSADYPYLELTFSGNGGKVAKAYYDSGDGTSTLTFKYQITDVDLDVDGINLFIEVKNWSNIYDKATYKSIKADPNFVLGLVSGDLSQVRVDGIVPVVNTATIPSGIYGIGSTIAITINADGSNYTADGIVTVNGEPSGFVNWGGGFYKVFYTVQTSNTNLNSVPSINVDIKLKDPAGNITPVSSVGVVGGTLTITTKPTYHITGTASRCFGSPSVPVTFTFTGVQPFSFKYSDGINPVVEINNHPSNTFVINALSGVYTITQLSDASGAGNALITSEAATITENPLPAVTFKLPEVVMSKMAAAYNLVDNIQSKDAGVGVFSGDYVATNGVFYPSLVPDADLGKNITITYLLTNSNSCSSTNTFDIKVVGDAAYLSGLSPKVYCNPTAAQSYDIKAEGIIGIVTSDNFTISGATENVEWEANGPRQIKIYPSRFTDKWHKITYTYFQGLNMYSVVDSFNVVRVSAIVDFNTLAAKYCSGDPQVSLIASTVYPEGGTGYFESTSGALLKIENATFAYFNPAAATFNAPISISYYYQTSETDGKCKSATVTKNTIVYSVPAADFTVLKHNYNYNEVPVVLVGTPTSSMSEFSGALIEGAATLNPSKVDLLNIGEDINITYKYVDETSGCSSTKVQKTKVYRANEKIKEVKADASKVDLSTTYCYADSIINLSCIPSIDGTTYQGYFFSKKGAIIQTPAFGNTATFNIRKAAKGDLIDTVRFTYKVGPIGNQTDYEIVKRVNIDSIGLVDFTIKDNFCKYEEPITIIGEHRLIDGISSYSYTDTIGFEKNAIFATFSPKLANVGTWDITYKFKSTSEKGCSSSVTKTINVNPISNVDFKLKAACPGTNVDIELINTSTEPSSMTWRWEWEGGGPSVSKDAIVRYSGSGLKTISLSGKTDKGCETSAEKQITVGLGANADFRWSNDCKSPDSVKFTNISSGGTLDSVVWKLDDVKIKGYTDSAKYYFANTGSYKMSLWIKTVEGCKNEIAKNFVVQPYFKITDNYFDIFKANKKEWNAKSIADNGNSSWVYGVPMGDIFSSTLPDTAWYTNIGLANQKIENSQVISPCFDFSELKKPMIKLDIWSAPEPGRDGAVLQYSTDGGNTWPTDSVLGVPNSGINWYDPGNLSSQPAGQSLGWSSTDLVTGWKSARYSLDTIKNRKNVRFRIVYATKADNNKRFNGFAFDNVWIGERKQIVLNEYFTNTLSLTGNASVAAFEQKFSDDIIPIHYHVDDNFYNFYTQGPSSRKFYYGISQIPNLVANGTIISSVANIADYETKADASTLLDPKFTFQRFDVVNGDINIEIKALADLPAQNLVLYCALVKISKQDGTSGPLYYNVLRRFFPNPGGTFLSSSTWTNNDLVSVSIPMYYTVEDEFINSRLIAFVQNANTNEVYQVAFYNTSTATGDHPINLSNLVDVYPNPARDYLIIECEHSIDRLMVFDLAGRVVGSYIPDQTKYSLPVQNLQGGVYILKGTTKKGEFIRKFVKQ